MSDAEFERERAQLFQKLGLRYDPESLNYTDNGLSTQQVKTALKRRTTAPPGVNAPTVQPPADSPAQSHTIPRKTSAPGEVAKCQIPTSAVTSFVPDTSRPTSPGTSNSSNSGHTTGSAAEAAYLQDLGEREEKSCGAPQTPIRASSPNRKLSSSVTSASNGVTAGLHELHQGAMKDGLRPSLLSVPKVKSLKPPSSGDGSTVAPSLGMHKSVTATALTGSKRSTEPEHVRKASLPEQSLPEQGGRADEEQVRAMLPVPSTKIKPTTKPSEAAGKPPARRDSVGSIQRLSQSLELSSGSSMPHPKLSVDKNLYDHLGMPDSKYPGNLSLCTDMEAFNGHHTSPVTEGVNFGNCTHCGLAVVGAYQGCIALEKVYHTECFICSKCGQGLNDRTYYVTSRSEILCEKDYYSNLPKCHKCQLHIENRVVHALGVAYHPGCFRCVVCGKEMEKIPYAGDDMQQIYCEKDYHLKFSPKCFSCCLPITPQLGKAKSMRVKAMGKYYHLECYKCEDCDADLAKVGSTEKRCYPIDEHLFCKNCSRRRTHGEATPQRDTSSSPIPHVKITPSPSPSPVPPLGGELGY